MSKTTLLSIGALVLPHLALADAVLDWNEVLLDAIRVDRTAPPRAARALAMVHIAAYNAVEATLRSSEASTRSPRQPMKRGAAAFMPGFIGNTTTRTVWPPAANWPST